MKEMEMWVVLAVGVVVTATAAHAAGYCSTNTFADNSTLMQFTKEPVPIEYGFQDKFKSIHCCVKGYRSIEWFKDGVAYPWSANVSNLILFPEAANQTLYTRRAARSDSGNYTCRLTNETHTETHTVTLDILEKPTDAPKTMFISNNQSVEEGRDVRLYCEALVGRSYLADAHSDLSWKRVWPNGTESDLLPTQLQIKTTREDVTDILGAYLVIGRVGPQDYGTYVCCAHSNEDLLRSHVTLARVGAISEASAEWCAEGGVPWRALALGGVAGALLLLTALVLHRRLTPRLLLAARHALASPPEPEKEWDVAVCWTSVDAELVRGALLPTLALKYKYRVRPCPLSTDPHTWHKEISAEVGRCRSVVVVLSPAQYSAGALLTALRQLRALPLAPVVVLLQDLPNLKRSAKEAGECIVSLMRRTRLVAWRHVHERAFWLSLRLALPPATARHTPEQTVTVTDESKYSRSTSMTALV